MSTSSSSKSQGFTLHRMCEFGVLGLLVVWLFGTAAVVQVEYYDGYDSICNAGHFLGTVKEYQATRAPFFGLALVPAEAIKQKMDLHPLDVRPHHFTMAIFHAVYLLGSYVMLIRLRGRTSVALLAFVAAVPTFLFFTYAPFISHDLLPGVIFLAMLLLGERFVRIPSPRDAVFLVLLGAAAATIKHTFALFWVIVLGVQVILLLLDKGEERRVRIKPLAMLLLCAVGSGLLAALVLGLALKNAFPDAGFIERIASQVKYLSGEAHDKSQVPPWWVYLRNFPAFGLLASLCVLPGLWFSWKEDRRMKGLVLAWIAAVIVIHLIGIRQVRYLAFVMPVTACLIVPVIQRGMVYKEGVAAMLAIILLTQFTRYSSAMEVARPFSSFYRDSEARKLIDQHTFPRGEKIPPVLVMNSHMLSFTDGRNTPLSGDVYHNLFHVHLHHIVDLYQLEPGDIIQMGNDQINRLEVWPAGSSLLVASTDILINPVAWQSAPPINKDLLMHMLFKDEGFTITRQSGNDYLTENRQALAVGTANLNGQTVHVMQAEWLKPLSPHVVNIRVHMPGRKVPVYGRIQVADQWLLPGLVEPPNGSSLNVRYFRKSYVHKNP